MLRRAVGNLLSNALRHTPRNGTIKVAVSPAPTFGQLRVAVENPGAPIPAEHLARLFDRFFRADAARRQGAAGGEGAGLGLAITRSIARAHGGELTATALAAGNRFELSLPAG
jgi:two-component system heavy metal sensor histidine kinase CusS